MSKQQNIYIRLIYINTFCLSTGIIAFKPKQDNSFFITQNQLLNQQLRTFVEALWSIAYIIVSLYLTPNHMSVYEAKPLTILLIDDDYEELDLFEVAVAESGLPITMLYVNECNSEKLKTFPRPDFIFLDINMPVFDGFYWLKGIREKVPEEIPIIMYSTTSIPQRIDLAFELGANLFLSKPDTVATLITALKKIVQLDWTNPRKIAEESFRESAFHLV